MNTVKIIVITVSFLIAWVLMGWLAMDTVGDKLKGRSIYAHMAVFALGDIVIGWYTFYAPLAAFLDIYRENQKDNKP